MGCWFKVAGLVEKSGCITVELADTRLARRASKSIVTIGCTFSLEAFVAYGKTETMLADGLGCSGVVSRIWSWIVSKSRIAVGCMLSSACSKLEASNTNSPGYISPINPQI